MHQKALIAMGYRCLDKDGKRVWLKPVGWVCFVFDPQTGELTCRLKNMNSPEVSVWSGTTLPNHFTADHETELKLIKEAEYTVFHNHWNADSRFDFFQDNLDIN